MYEDVNGVRRNFNYNTLNQLDSSSDLSAGVAYEWDAEARLTAVSKGTARSEFRYDGLGPDWDCRETERECCYENTYLWCDSELCEARDSSGSTVLKRLFPQGETGGPRRLEPLFYQGPSWQYSQIWMDQASRNTVRLRPVWRADGSAGELQSTPGFAGYFVHAQSGLNLTLFRH
jgi:hypothetical protein